jgi:hypothetical protein
MCTQLPSTAIKYGFRDPIKKSNLRLEIAETLDIRQFALSRHLVFFCQIMFSIKCPLGKCLGKSFENKITSNCATCVP